MNNKTVVFLMSTAIYVGWISYDLQTAITGDSGLTGLPGPKGDRGDGGKFITN